MQGSPGEPGRRERESLGESSCEVLIKQHFLAIHLDRNQLRSDDRDKVVLAYAGDQRVPLGPSPRLAVERLERTRARGTVEPERIERFDLCLFSGGRLEGISSSSRFSRAVVKQAIHANYIPEIIEN